MSMHPSLMASLSYKITCFKPSYKLFIVKVTAWPQSLVCFISNSNKYLVTPVWISYAEGETIGKRASWKDNEQYGRGEQHQDLNLFQNIKPPP